MATSGVTTGLMTAGEVVRTSYELLGVFAPEDDLTADRMDYGIKQLNWMLKSWQTDGLNLWRDQGVSITFPASANGEGVLSANYLDLFDVFLVQDGSNRPLLRRERGDAWQFRILAQTGTPVVYTPYRQKDALWLKLWPAPLVDVTLLADVARVVEDVTASTQTIDVPQEWTECLFYGLADRLSGMTGVVAKETPLAQQVAARAAQLYRQMSDADRPESYTFRAVNSRW